EPSPPRRRGRGRDQWAERDRRLAPHLIETAAAHLAPRQVVGHRAVVAGWQLAELVALELQPRNRDAGAARGHGATSTARSPTSSRTALRILLRRLPTVLRLVPNSSAVSSWVMSSTNRQTSTVMQPASSRSASLAMMSSPIT